MLLADSPSFHQSGLGHSFNKNRRQFAYFVDIHFLACVIRDTMLSCLYGWQDSNQAQRQTQDSPVDARDDDRARQDTATGQEKGGEMKVISGSTAASHRQDFQPPISPISKIRKQASKTAFHVARARIRWRHFLYRLRWPCHAHVPGIFLLLLDPVQYELAPLLHPDKPTTIRQKLAHALVRRVLYGDAAPECFAPSPEALAIAAAVVEKWSRSARK